MTEQELNDYIEDRYGIVRDYPWDDDAYVFRHADNRKWFGLLMHVCRSRLTHDESDVESTDVLNVKCPPEAHGSFIDGIAVFPAYHMNREHWLSVDIKKAEDSTVCTLLDLSYEITQYGRRKTGV